MKKNDSNHALSPRMKLFLDEQRIFCKDSTIGSYRTALSSFDEFFKKRLRVSAISRHNLSMLTHDILTNWLLHLSGLKPWSKINYFLPVRKYLAWEADRNTIRPKTIARFQRSLLPKPPDMLPKPLSPENDALLVTRLRVSDHPYAPLFLLLRFTGMRISELINLQNDCLQLTPKREAYLKIPLGKMNNERLVPLHDEAVNIIQNLLKSKGVRSQNHPLMHERHASRLIGLQGSIASVYSKLDRPFRKISADILDQGKSVTFHRLRHTYATSLLSAGVGIVSIMKLLGHRRIEMSLRYAGITPTLIRNEYLKAMQKLEQRWISHDNLSDSPLSPSMTPISLIDILRASIKNDQTISSQSRYNFLKRLSRLKAELNQQHTAKCPLTFLPSQKSADLLAG